MVLLFKSIVQNIKFYIFNLFEIIVNLSYSIISPLIYLINSTITFLYKIFKLFNFIYYSFTFCWIIINIMIDDRSIDKFRSF